MTVCSIYFQGGIVFWISIILSVLVVGFLSLYLPFKKIKSKRKYAFIPLFIVLLFIVVIVNIGFLGMKDSCDGLWDRHFVKDYGRNITSIEEANNIFRGLAYDMFDQPSNDTEKMVERSLNYTRLYNGLYSVNFGFSCYELHTNGELYSYWCGD